MSFELKMNFATIDDLQDFIATLPPRTHTGRVAAPAYNPMLPSPVQHMPAPVAHHTPLQTTVLQAIQAPVHHAPAAPTHTVADISAAMQPIMRMNRPGDVGKMSAVLKKYAPTGAARDVPADKIAEVLAEFQMIELGA